MDVCESACNTIHTKQPHAPPHHNNRDIQCDSGDIISVIITTCWYNTHCCVMCVLVCNECYSSLLTSHVLPHTRHYMMH